MKTNKIFLMFSLIVCILGFTANSYAISLLPLVPENAGVVINFNLQKILNQKGIRAVVDKLIPIENSKDFENFYKKSGINPVKDIENVMIFLDKNGKTGILVNGTFDTDKIAAIAQKDAGIAGQISFEDLNGFKLLKSNLNKNGNTLIVDKYTLAFGEMAILDTITYLKGEQKKSILSNHEFAGLIHKMSMRSAFWGATVNTGKASDNSPVVAALENVKTSYFSVDYDKAFIFNFTGKVAAPKELPAFKNSLKNILDVFKGWCAAEPEVLKVLKKAKVQAKGTLARIIMRIPAKEFEALVKKLAEKSKK